MLGQLELEIAQNLPPEGCGLEEAQKYTRWLATRHYENFRVVTWLLPSRLHQHFYNVYAYCRWSDDLGDEISDPQRALTLLNAWENELLLAFRGSAKHPVMVALANTVREFDIPVDPFRDLLVAFRQDQTIQRYATWDDVLLYCRHSANPVGRLVLYLIGYRDEERQALSDPTCTALQLANFWQDVSRDLEKGRIYIPLECIAAHGLTEQEILARVFDSRYVALMKELIARTRGLFDAGAPLSARVSPQFRVDLEMFRRGGCAVLEAIESIGYDTLHRRPSINRWTQLRLLSRAMISRTLSPFRPAPVAERKAESAPLAGGHV